MELVERNEGDGGMNQERRNKLLLSCREIFEDDDAAE